MYLWDTSLGPEEKTTEGYLRSEPAKGAGRDTPRPEVINRDLPVVSYHFQVNNIVDSLLARRA